MLSLRRIPQQPQRRSGTQVAHDARIVPIEERRSAVLLGIVQRDTLRQMSVRIDWDSQKHQGGSQSAVRRDEHTSVLRVLCQRQELLTEGVRCLVLRAYLIIIPQS